MISAGVRVFFYLEDRERTLDSPIEKVMLSIQTMADEMEREKARQRMIDTMTRKAKTGHVTGGRCFEYDNVEVLDAGGRRSHVERRINEREAAVVRRIFELSAAGTGYSRIAKILNDDRAPSPQSQQGRPAGWAPTSVKAVLERTAYRGEITWNRTRKRDRWGQRRQADRPGGEWLRRVAPELRMLPDELWNATHGRLAGVRAQMQAATDGDHGGRQRARDADSEYLLAGFARCACCGGRFGVVRRRGAGAYSYGCLTYNKRGPNVCSNRLTLPMERVDGAVLEAMVGQVLRPSVVDAIVVGVLEALAPERRQDDGKALRRDLAEVERELSRLATAVAQGGALTPLLTAMQERQAARDGLVRKIAALEAPNARIDAKAVEQKVRAKLADWRGLVARNDPDGRQFLREALAGPLRFTPEEGQHRFAGEVALGRVLTGIVGGPTFVAPPGRLARSVTLIFAA